MIIIITNIKRIVMKKRNRKKKDKYKKDIHDLKGENYYDSDGF